MNEEIETEKDFLQIKAIRTSSNAFVMKLEEGDIIIALDGLIVNKSYDDLTKELNEIEDKKILTLYRDGVFFNTFVYGSLGVICESVNSNTIPDLKKLDPNNYFNQDDFYFQFEVYKKPQKTAILLNTFPTILAKKHSCGLGNTYDYINEVATGDVYPCLNYDSWLEQIKTSL